MRADDGAPDDLSLIQGEIVKGITTLPQRQKRYVWAAWCLVGAAIFVIGLCFGTVVASVYFLWQYGVTRG